MLRNGQKQPLKNLTSMAKQKINTGSVEGFGPTWRDESPRETLIREGTVHEGKEKTPKIIKALNFFADIIEGQERVHTPIIKKGSGKLLEHIFKDF